MARITVTGMREARKIPAVLKIELSAIRSRGFSGPICVFEGKTDVGPYEVWFGRISDALDYQPVVADGKGQVLGLRNMLELDEEGLSERVYFLIDRDFDDLRGCMTGPDLFCTDRYSVENYLVDESVLRSYLVDELECSVASDDIDNVINNYSVVMRQFLGSVKELNLHHFISKKLKISINKKPEKLKGIVTVNVDQCVGCSMAGGVRDVLELNREPSVEEAASVQDEFDRLDPVLRYRGKYCYLFFLAWIDALISERKSNSHGFFCSAKNVKASAQRITPRSLATRSPIPLGLTEFVGVMGS